MNDDYFDRQVAGPHSEADPEAPRPDNHAETPNPASKADSAPAEPEIPGGTPSPLKAAVQDLLKFGLVEEAAKPNVYARLVRERDALAAILEPLDFLARFDEIRGIVFLETAPPDGDAAETPDTADDDAWNHPLVRRKRLTTEQSLLLAILRQMHIAYEQDCGIGAADAMVDLDELRAQFDLYLGSTGSEQRDLNRVLKVLEQLKKHGVVTDPDRENRVRIRPIIVHVADPTQLALLLEHFKRTAGCHPAEPNESETDTAPTEDNDG